MGPVIRPEIINRQTTKKEDFILVYVMDDSFHWIVPQLKKFKNEQFVVTGIDSHQRKEENITFKKIDPSGFIEDFTSAKGIIATAGHSLIGEALALCKPLLTLVQQGQFEQYLNAYYLEKLEYGMCCKAKGDLYEDISRFLSSLSSLEKNISDKFKPGNKQAANAVIEMLKKTNE